MANLELNFMDWTFEVDKKTTVDSYKKITESGADSCSCNDCKNYVAVRNRIFPKEVLILFSDLGIDYSKEVEISTYGITNDDLYHISGWFHFSGKF